MRRYIEGGTGEDASPANAALRRRLDEKRYQRAKSVVDQRNGATREALASPHCMHAGRAIRSTRRAESCVVGGNVRDTLSDDTATERCDLERVRSSCYQVGKLVTEPEKHAREG